jgi:hypothetical protein
VQESFAGASDGDRRPNRRRIPRGAVNFVGQGDPGIVPVVAVSDEIVAASPRGSGERYSGE